MANTKSTSGRSRTTKKRGRDRLFLYFLLIVIAGLLGLLVALLPDSPGGESLVVAGESRTPESIIEPDPAPRSDEDETDPAITDSVAVEQAEEGEGATEIYPMGETVPEAVESPASSEDELWWLPEPETYGDVFGTLYLILDDAGNSIGPLPEFLEFPGPLAVAVLPRLTYSVESAARIAAAGKEIMLHLPMEAVGGANPGPGALTAGMSDRDILVQIEENLGSVPGAVGVNNHMGSLVTADPRIMEIVLADLKRRKLFFVDSRTTVDSVARSIAAGLRTPFAERHVFLDNERSRDAILAAIRGALELAHQQESVVMIGHATVAELARVLNEVYPILIESGYRFGVVSNLVAASFDPEA